jgi:uncharacterized protein with ParB-like and HNH nuclease domain
MNYNEIKKLTSIGSYQINVRLDYFESVMKRYVTKYRLELNPDFQRGHVWTESQQTKYVEFLLRGGKTGRTIYFNCPRWKVSGRKDFVVVDGLQRLTALTRFLNNEIRAFGHYEKEFDGYIDADVFFNINNLQTREEVLQWYLELNSTGTPHKKGELDRVRELIELERRSKK